MCPTATSPGKSASVGSSKVSLDQAHPAMIASDALAIDRHDAGALLSAMLQRVQAEVGEPRRVRNSRDADDAAHRYAPADRSTSG